MAEYIERENAIAWFMSYAHTGESIDADVVISDVKGMKAADVAPVTRCKDCRYRGLICCPAIHETIGNGLVDYTVDNGYCWCGKPKET